MCGAGALAREAKLEKMAMDVHPSLTTIPAIGENYPGSAGERARTIYPNDNDNVCQPDSFEVSLSPAASSFAEG